MTRRQNSIDLAVSASTDGFTIGGGATERNLTVKSGDVSFEGGSGNSYDFPNVSDTLVGETATQTLTNKTITGSFSGSFGGSFNGTASWADSSSRAISASWAPNVGGTTDHGSLDGLGDDDHSQYLLTTGGRALTGNWNAGQQITSSFSGDGSQVTGVISSSYALSASYADNGGGSPGGTGITWSTLTAGITSSVNTGYLVSGSAKLHVYLPATATAGDIVRMAGVQEGGWRLSQNPSQRIHFGNDSASLGAAGYLESTHYRDAVEVVCVLTDDDWQVISSIGSILIT